ncbi:hypothetical protein E8E14_005617 [Neopestalotiopsis sp. 37M]|nr:hypothetical protein E8E14_005617 [Neopestalotiopsis sp. 37M]
MKSISSLFLGALLAGVASSAAASRHPRATIDSGVVIGSVTTLPSNKTSYNFYGVPYAAKPERFQPAVQPEPWTSARNATVKQNVACYQNYIYNAATYDNLMTLVVGPNTEPPEEREDCLTLDVYAPPFGSNATKKAVLFWIYGGSYRTGANTNPNYDGSSFAGDQDVILVSPNYRLNVHGFPANPQLEDPDQNLGLLDLRLALEWTRNNVAAFGGDPEKITLIGQSAGAAIVDMMISAPPDPLNFRAAIMESGQASYNGGAAVPGWAYNTLAKDIGCNGTAAEKYTCMTTASAKRLKNVSEKQGIWFGPPIQDGATWAKAPRQNRLHSTNESSVMARVPVLLGSNAEEGAIYTTGVQNAVAFLQEHYGFSKAKAKALLEYYPIVAGSRIQTPQDQATAVMTESSFGCPAGFVYNDSLSVGIPSWRYYFNASFPNSELVPGAYHASEIPLVFGSYQRENATDFQASLSQDMQQAWSRFAKNPTAGPGWRQDAVAVFGGNASPGETDEGRPTMTLATTSWMDQRCALYKPSA